MSASNKPQAPVAASLAALPAPIAGAVYDLWRGSLGRTVRCVPTRRTVSCVVAGERLFGKWRQGHRRAAAAEWRWLHTLPLLGIRVPSPVAWLGEGCRTLLVTAAAPGRPMDAWLAAAAAEGWLHLAIDFACRRVAPLVRRLHDRGLVHRDLYWNHVFTPDPRGDAEVTLIDVERVVRPARFWWRRWVVKDLAGLLASSPVPVPARGALRFLRAYLGGPCARRGDLVAAVWRKAERIRAHVPRFG